jgi:hypothetical protein
MMMPGFFGTAFCERVSEVRPIPFNRPALCPATDNAGEGRGADHLPATYEAVPKSSVGGRRPKPGGFCRAKVAEGGAAPYPAGFWQGPRPSEKGGRLIAAAYVLERVQSRLAYRARETREARLFT